MNANVGLVNIHLPPNSEALSDTLSLLALPFPVPPGWQTVLHHSSQGSLQVMWMRNHSKPLPPHPCPRPREPGALQMLWLNSLPTTRFLKSPTLPSLPPQENRATNCKSKRASISGQNEQRLMIREAAHDQRRSQEISMFMLSFFQSLSLFFDKTAA